MSTCDCGRPVHEVPAMKKVKAVFGTVDPLLVVPATDTHNQSYRDATKSIYVDNGESEVYPEPEVEREVLAELMGESYVDATRQLLAFAHARADKGHIREFADRDFRKDAAEELADFLNYTLWALRRGDDPCPNRLGNALRHVVAAYHELLQED